MNEHFAGLNIYTTRGQFAVLLGQALRELQHGPERQECFEFIKRQNWLDIHPADSRPYPSVSNEPRWQTLLSWAREDLAVRDYIDRSINNCWRPTMDGINESILIHRRFASGELHVRECYMWTVKFKKHMCPTYQPSDNETQRPPHVYEDELPKWQNSVRGNSKDDKFWREKAAKMMQSISADPAKLAKAREQWKEWNFQGNFIGTEKQCIEYQRRKFLEDDLI